MNTDVDKVTELVPAWLERRIGQHIGSPGITLSRSFRTFCRDFLGFLSDRHDLRLATMWSVNPVRSELILVASVGATAEQLGEPVLDYFTDLNGICLSSKETVEVLEVSRSEDDYGRAFSLEHLVAQLDLTRMISVPIINTCNSNQVLLVMNVYPTRGSTDPSPAKLSQYADWLAPRFETFLHDHCVRFANRLSISIGKLKNRYPEDIYALLVDLLSQVIDADSIGIYIEKDDLKGVERKKWGRQRPDDEALSQVDRRATACYERNREFLILSRSELREIARGELLPAVPVIAEKKIRSEIFVPLRDLTGRADGVFYCIKTSDYTQLSAYTYEDVAAIEAVAEAFTPQLEILLAENQRTDSMNKLAHELRVPVVAFRAALERVERECKTNRYEFQFDHFEELRTYCDVMNRLLKELDVARKGPHQIPLQPRRTHIFSEIIPPAVRFVGPILKKKGLTPYNIQYQESHKTPGFFLDLGMMTQVVFNLLDNAIKYSLDNPDKVKIEIEGNDAGDNYEILFSDNGIGVPEGWGEKIFDPGVRGPNAHGYDVAGEGLGLWFARAITRRHGGDVVLRKRKNPTVFAVLLPNSLRNAPPRAPIGTESKP